MSEIEFLNAFVIHCMGRCHPRVGSQRKGGTKKKEDKHKKEAVLALLQIRVGKAFVCRVISDCRMMVHIG
jgi:hypothetical protein